MTLTEKLLTTDFNNQFEIDVNWIGILNYSLIQAKLPFINEIIIRNNSDMDIQETELSLDFEFEHIESQKINIPKISEGKEYRLDPKLIFRAKKVFELTETIMDCLRITWTDSEGTQLAQKSLQFDVLPMNQWTGSKIFPESLASFVQPNTPQIINLQKRASQLLKKRTGSSAFTGYLTDNKTEILNQLAAIYGAIYEQNIAYSVNLPDFSSVGQRIRTPQEILQYKMGNCIEMAVLYASVAESCGFHPFVILTKGHAFVGVWLKEALFDENIITDYTELSKRLSSGINDLEVIEATYMNEGQKKLFDQAIRSARGTLENIEEFELVIDIKRAHFMGIRPMPIFVEQDGETKLIDYGLAEDAINQAANIRSIEEYFLDTSKKEAVDKRKIWMRNLLDLSKRNNLISFRPGPKAIQLFNSDIGQLEDALSNGQSFLIKEAFNDWEISKKKINFVDVESNKEVISQLSLAEFKGKKLRTFLSKPELDKTLKTIYRETRISIEENGSSSLFLAAGFLRWIDPKDELDQNGNPVSRLAPLILLPVDLIRKNNQSYTLQLRDEDAQMNITLLEMLRQNFNLNISGLNPLPEDEAGVDIQLVFNSIRKAIMELKEWDVLEIAVLGNFSFSQFVMWDDLNKRFDRLIENKVIQSLVDGRYYESNNQFQSENLEDTECLRKIITPTDTDASQLLAIAESAKESSFVLHGPPGTGKSQTITNIIANALYNGKTVLFVAEKMAALSVVAERLNQIGIGDFTLEVHSNKTKKQTVLDKFGQCFDLKIFEDDNEFQRKFDQISEKRQLLHDMVFEIHKPQKIGKSIFQLIQWNESLTNISDVLSFSEETVANFDQNQWELVLQSVKRLSVANKGLSKPVHLHPLRHFHLANYELQSKEKLRNVLQQLKELLENNTNEKSGFKFEWLKQSNRLNQLINLVELYEKHNIQFDVDTSNWLKLPDVDLLKNLKDLNKKQSELLQLKEDLEKVFISKIDTLNWQQIKLEILNAKQSFILTRGKNIKRALLPIYSIAKKDVMLDDDLAILYLEKIGKYQDLKLECDQQLKYFSENLGYSFNQDFNSKDSVSNVICLLEHLKNNHLYNSDVFQDILVVQSKRQERKLSDFKKNLVEIQELITEFLTLTGYSDLINDQDAKSLLEKIMLWQLNLDYWKEWSQFYKNILDLDALGLTEMGEYINLSQNQSSQFNIYEVFLASIIPTLINLYVGQSKLISNFSGQNYDVIASEFNELTNNYVSLAKNQIVMNLSSNIPDTKTCSDEEAKQIAQLKKAIQSKGRGLSIRKIFHENSQIIRRLTPCFLMSPLSVAQYIDMDFPKFDLVIFDEASQIKTSTAIGAMSRAKNCIIVGDPQQMPPTNFFGTSKIDEDNLLIEDLESLLEDCLSVNMPQRYLTHHYRSQSESLISFSNKMYYDNKMLTFPSPHDRTSKVSFIKVEGVYDRGNTRTNKPEALAIISEIKNHILSENSDSIGVITFNVSQQNLIDDLLQKELSNDPVFADSFTNMSEPIFIKNLENVQGDERDKILFSIGFGPDETGKFYQNFGPLGRPGGWRRLNVAVSRARKEMKVFSTITADDINLTARSQEGVKGLKEFLLYAQSGTLENRNIKDNLSQKGMIESIANYIQQKGLSVDINVGNSEFKVQIAIVNPIKPKEYCAAIQIDNQQFAKIKTTDDRVRLIPKILKNKGWEILYIWSIDWFENKNFELSRIDKFLSPFLNNNNLESVYNQTVQNIGNSNLVEGENNSSELEKIRIDSNIFDSEELEKDTICNNHSVENCKNSFETVIESYSILKPEQIFPNHLFKNQPKIDIEIAQKIISLEAPIHIDVLKRRILSHYDKVKLTKVSNEYLEMILTKTKSKKRIEDGELFYWGQIDYRNYHQFRIQNKPDISLISSIELKNGF
ncbi:DUF4011 domain-containing protein [Vaginisenegalia massiliensis]|uniref:DUF4011 domain-containing protein n=1 Tax=Vaginisenegalia massiliensis TaxID=2058294 RepID=UPI000F5265CC|nr:DUF4011 domain-containing protein [Vaginisenegalia massiliensis]